MQAVGERPGVEGLGAGLGEVEWRDGRRHPGRASEDGNVLGVEEEDLGGAGERRCRRRGLRRRMWENRDARKRLAMSRGRLRRLEGEMV